jgi:hypothetical protein
MKNRKTTMIIIALAYILSIVTVILDLHYGMSKADVFNHICRLLILLISTMAVLQNKNTDKE